MSGVGNAKPKYLRAKYIQYVLEKCGKYLLDYDVFEVLILALMYVCSHFPA